jgi:drug/metabolite transporter (DMT)-like permease
MALSIKLKRIGASTIEPVVTVLSGILIFSEGAYWTRFLGMALILGGAVILAKSV